MDEFLKKHGLDAPWIVSNIPLKNFKTVDPEIVLNVKYMSKKKRGCLFMYQKVI